MDKKYYKALQNYILATEFDEIDTSFADVIFLTKTYTYGKYDSLTLQIGLFANGIVAVSRMVLHGNAHGTMIKHSFRKADWYI